MTTQRVNTYTSNNEPVFYIEQYNSELAQWFTVGDTYDKYQLAATMVELHNARQIANLLSEGKS